MEKKFKDTKVGGFLNKLKTYAPELLPEVLNIVPGARGVKSLLSVANILRDKSVLEKNDSLSQLLEEFEDNEETFTTELLELEISDRMSARNREIELAKLQKKDWMMIGVGATMVLSFLSAQFTVMFVEIPEPNREMFTHMLSMIDVGFFGGMVAYLYGAQAKKNEQSSR